MKLTEQLEPQWLEVIAQLQTYLSGCRERLLKASVSSLNSETRLAILNQPIERRWSRLKALLAPHPDSLSEPSETYLNNRQYTRALSEIFPGSHFNVEQLSILTTLLQYHVDIVSHYLTPPVLKCALETGKPQAKLALTLKDDQIFNSFNQNAEVLCKYALAFAIQNIRGNLAIAQWLSQKTAGTVLDVGGGLGDFCHALLGTGVYTHLKVYEKADSISQLDHLRRSSLGRSYASIQFIGGDFFSAAPHEGLVGITSDSKFDLLTLGWILHDWDDSDCIQILKRCKQHLKPGGKVAVLEKLIRPENCTKMAQVDILMLAMSGGMERDANEYQALFTEAGLSLRETYFNPKGRDVMLLEVIS